MTRLLPPSSDRLQITALDEPNGAGGPTHTMANTYEVRNFDASTNISWDGTNQHAVTILMQNGPVTAGKPANGLTEEALLAILLDRMNAVGWEKVIEHLREAQAYLSSERAKAQA